MHAFLVHLFLYICAMMPLKYDMIIGRAEGKRKRKQKWSVRERRLTCHLWRVREIVGEKLAKHSSDGRHVLVRRVVVAVYG